VKVAVLLMFTGAALSVLSGLLAFTTQDEMRSLMEDELARQGQDAAMTTTMLDTIVQVTLAVSLVFGVLGAILWVVNAVFNGKGHNWARILSTVLGAIWLLSFTVSLLQPAPAVSKVLSVLNALLVIAVLVLLWLRPSNQFFSQSSAARRHG